MSDLPRIELEIWNVEPVLAVQGHPSAADAIAASRESNRRSRAPEYTAALSGRALIDAEWNEREWLLQFADSLWLRLEATPFGIYWDLLHSQPLSPRGRSPLRPFRWLHGAISHMRAESWIEERRGLACVRVSALPVSHLVYFKTREVLWFSAVRRKESGEPLMHVFSGY